MSKLSLIILNLLASISNFMLYATLTNPSVINLYCGFISLGVAIIVSSFSTEN